MSNDYPQMTNAEYRTELHKIFENIHENYKLRWFFVFISEKLRMTEEEKGGVANG